MLGSKFWAIRAAPIATISSGLRFDLIGFL